MTVTFIVYEGDGEVMVTTPEREADFLNEYAGARDFDNFDRTELNGASVRIFPRSLIVTD